MQGDEDKYSFGNVCTAERRRQKKAVRRPQTPNLFLGRFFNQERSISRNTYMSQTFLRMPRPYPKSSTAMPLP